MDNITFKGGRVVFSRSEKERTPLVHALNRVEGQIQGIRRMIEEDRYCGDELQQFKATISALRSVAKTISTQHIEAATAVAAGHSERAKILDEISSIIRKTLDL